MLSVKRPKSLSASLILRGTQKYSVIAQGLTQLEYFLSSGDKIAYFFESGASNEDGQLEVAPEYCLNKIGHAMHDLHPVFSKFSRDPRLEEISQEIGLSSLKSGSQCTSLNNRVSAIRLTGTKTQRTFTPDRKRESILVRH